MLTIDLIALSILCYISFFCSLWVRRRKILNAKKSKISSYVLIRSLSIILLAILLFYYIILYGILGWTFYWEFVGYLLFIVNIIVLDIFLIAYKTDDRYSHICFLDIKRYWVSKIYLVIRSLYVYGTMACFIFYTLIYGFLGGATVSVLSAISLTPEVFIDGILKNKSKTEKASFFMQRPFEEREFDNIETICSSYLKESVFCKDLVFKKKANSRIMHIYIRKSQFFNKYLYSFYYNNREGEGDEYRLSFNEDTLYIGRRSITHIENFIIKEPKGYYKHVIKRLDKSRLNHNEEKEINYKNYPELYITEFQYIGRY